MSDLEQVSGLNAADVAVAEIGQTQGDLEDSASVATGPRSVSLLELASLPSGKAKDWIRKLAGDKEYLVLLAMEDDLLEATVRHLSQRKDGTRHVREWLHSLPRGKTEAQELKSALRRTIEGLLRAQLGSKASKYLENVSEPRYLADALNRWTGEAPDHRSRTPAVTDDSGAQDGLLLSRAQETNAKELLVLWVEWQVLIGRWPHESALAALASLASRSSTMPGEIPWLEIFQRDSVLATSVLVERATWIQQLRSDAEERLASAQRHGENLATELRAERDRARLLEAELRSTRHRATELESELRDVRLEKTSAVVHMDGEFQSLRARCLSLFGTLRAHLDQVKEAIACDPPVLDIVGKREGLIRQAIDNFQKGI